YIWVDTQGYWSLSSQFFCNSVDGLQFCFGFYNKAVYTFPECIVDFFLGFTDSCKSTTTGTSTGLEDPIEFPTRDNVKPRSQLSEKIQDSQIRISFNCIAD